MENANANATCCCVVVKMNSLVNRGSLKTHKKEVRR